MYTLNLALNGCRSTDGTLQCSHVVLATGGYANDRFGKSSLLLKFRPDLVKLVCVCVCVCRVRGNGDEETRILFMSEICMSTYITACRLPTSNGKWTTGDGIKLALVTSLSPIPVKIKLY